MKKVLSPKEQALAAVDAVIKSPHCLKGWTMGEMVMDLWGGPEASMCSASEAHDAVIELMEFAEKHSYTNVAGNNLLNNLRILFSCMLQSRQNQAEVQRWAIEANDDEMLYTPFLTDEHFLNIAKRHELLLEMDRLEAESRDINKSFQDNRQKEAA